MSTEESAQAILLLAKRYEAGEISAGVFFVAVTYAIDDCTDEIIDCF